MPLLMGRTWPWSNTFKKPTRILRISRAQLSQQPGQFPRRTLAPAKPMFPNMHAVVLRVDLQDDFGLHGWPLGIAYYTYTIYPRRKTPAY